MIHPDSPTDDAGEKVQTSALSTDATSAIDVTPPLPGGGSWRMDGGKWIPNTNTSEE